MSEFIRRFFKDEIDRARIDGWQEGFIEGFKETFKETFEKSIREEMTIKIARNLLKMNMSHEQIAEATGLQLSVVEELADES